MRTRLSTILLALGCLGAGAAAAWTPEPCRQDTAWAQTRHEYERAVKEAAPGSALYTAHPFPKTDQEVVESFIEFHSRAFADMPAERLGTEEQALFNALGENRLRFEVHRVVNWTPLACGPRKARRFFFVIRMIDRENGEELARASVDETGHVARLRHRPEGAGFPPWPALTEARAVLRARVAPGAHDPQLVATWGTLRCDEVEPCVAMRDGNRLWLTTSGAVYRIDLARPEFSFRRDLGAGRREAVLQAVAQAGEKLISLGGDRFAVAEPAVGGDGPGRP